MESKNMAYADVIDVLMSGKVNFEAIAVGLAKVAPEVFLSLHAGAADMSKGQRDKQEIIAFIKANPGRKIDAIKLTRTLNGMGLKEAKEYVEALEVIAPSYVAPPLFKMPSESFLRSPYDDEGDF